MYCFQKANKADTVSVVDNVRIENKITITTNEKTNFIVIQFNKDGISKVDIENAKVMVNEGKVALSYEPYKETTATIPTENGLAGIHVDSGGNYTDSNGQQWICDEIVKYTDGSGEYVQQVKKIIFDGSSDESWGKSSHQTNNSYYIDQSWVAKGIAGRKIGMICNRFIEFDVNDIVEKDNVGCSYGVSGLSQIRLGFGLASEITTVNLLKEWLSSNPVEIVCILSEPIRTPLTSEQLAEIEKLSTFYPVTNISNDSDCGMRITYLVDSKNYINRKVAEQVASIVENIK